MLGYDCKNSKESKLKSLLVQLGKLKLGFILFTLSYFQKHSNILSFD